MIFVWLRACLAVEASVLVVAAILSGATSNPVAIASAVIGALFAVNFCAIVVIYAVLRCYGRRWSIGPKAHMLHHRRHAVGECLALLALFAQIAPFERWWMGSDAVGRLAPGSLPVLLVHGYLCNRGLWWWLRRHLRQKGHAIATVNLEPAFAGLDHFAAQLHHRVEALVAESGADQLVLVTHSMGGLVARAYLQQHRSDRVAKLVTLAAPHRGTQVARLGCGRNAREMEPDSAWLRRLNGSQALPIEAVTVWSCGDEFIVPHDSGRLPTAREHVLADLGHVAMAFSPTVLRILQAELITH